MQGRSSRSQRSACVFDPSLSFVCVQVQANLVESFCHHLECLGSAVGGYHDDNVTEVSEDPTGGMQTSEAPLNLFKGGVKPAAKMRGERAGVHPCTCMDRMSLSCVVPPYVNGLRVKPSL